MNREVSRAGDSHCALPGNADETLTLIGGTIFLIALSVGYAAV